VPREPAGPRPFWSGTITFGLVSVPVNIYPANRRNRVSLRMLGPDGRPLSRRYFAGGEGDEEELSRQDIVRAWETGEGAHVPVSDEELEAVAPEKSRDIDLTRFVDASEIDPVYFQRAYFLTPAGDSTKAYRLLAAVMERTGRAGIASFVMRAKEYLVAILAEGGILRAETLRFPDEVRSAEDVGLPAADEVDVPAKRVEQAAKAIRAAAGELDEDEMRDEDSRRLLAVIERKRKAGEDVVTTAPADEETEDGEAGGAEVIDLMEVIKRSLEGEGRKPPRRAGGAARRREPAGERLEELSKSELYERAKAADLPGRSSMTKPELVRALRRSA
jgi:DNA end-binding protein Ku